MGWSTTALTALTFAADALAQGSYGGLQPSCNSNNAFLNLGCYSSANTNALHAAFNWQLSSSTNSEKYYPGFTGSNLTPELCQTACRGHGFKYAATFDGGECYCSSTFPAPANPPPASTSNGPNAPFANPPSSSSPSLCMTNCSGSTSNNTEYCGGVDAATVYYDPSFTNSSSAATSSNYKYLGCFNNNSPGPTYISIETTSTQACVSYCGQLGYAVASRSGIDSYTASTTCGCGSEVQASLETDESDCTNNCDGTTGS